jgi:hypothetical protein
MDRDTFGSARSIGEKLQADVEDVTPTGYWVTYPDGDTDIEPNTTKNELLFETDVLDPDDPEVQFIDQAYGTVGSHGVDDGITTEFWMDLESGRARLVTDDSAIELDTDRKFEALQILIEYLTPRPDDDVNSDDFYDDLEHRVETATALYELFIEIKSERVRRGVVGSFIDARYNDEDGRIVPVDGGVAVDETFKVTYEAENYLIDAPDTYRIQGGDVVEVDETHEFIDVDFETTTVKSIECDGQTFHLSEREQSFLATVEALCHPQRHLEVQTANRVERAVEGDVGDAIESIAATADVNAYKDEITGLVHDHHPNKHTLTASFRVTQWVLDEMYFTEYDHAGVNELSAMESELREADRSVFHDTHNDDDERWNAIHDTADSAQIHAHIQQQIDAMH